MKLPRGGVAVNETVAFVSSVCLKRSGTNGYPECEFKPGELVHMIAGKLNGNLKLGGGLMQALFPNLKACVEFRTGLVLEYDSSDELALLQLRQDVSNSSVGPTKQNIGSLVDNIVG